MRSRRPLGRHGFPRNVPLSVPITVAILTYAVCGGFAWKHCPPCGNSSVPYPLSTASDCGDQSYKIRCDAGALIFPSSNNTYPIASISPSIQRLVIKPAHILPNACVTSDFPTKGIELDPALPFKITEGNTVIYLNCSDYLLGSNLNCSSNSLCHVYLRATPEAAPCIHAPLCCAFKSGGSLATYHIRVRDTRCHAYTSFVGLDPTRPVSAWGQPGVELQWLPPREPLCATQTDCRGLGGNATCRAAAPGIKRCFCGPGFFWDSVNGLCAHNVTCVHPGKCGRSNKAPIIAGFTSLVGATLVAATLGLLFYLRRRHAKQSLEHRKIQRESILSSSGAITSKLFTEKEIKRATDSFAQDRLLGVGGFGEVYKGDLDDGSIVAVKCAKVGSDKGTDQVLNEVMILSQVNHRSLVRLLGCCVEVERPLLVYEYVPNGTLFERLHALEIGQYPLTWAQRLRIAHQTAEGLAYLHSSAVPPIYHRDVKSSNILLDYELNAKVSDFGLSKLVETDMTHISTCAQGTLGYLDPDYYKNYQLTDKSDVYSFGVVLLELITSKKALDFNREADDVNLVVYMKKTVDDERLMDVVDPILKEKATPLELDTIKALGFLAMGCLEERRQNRPSMREVTEEIEYIVNITASRENIIAPKSS